jgi:hypothetical protein
MSTASVHLTAFNWGAPLHQPFTRASGPTFWPTDSRCRPLHPATRRACSFRLLLWMQPPELTSLLRERFKPTRGDLRWDTPPALPGSVRSIYEQAALRDFSDTSLSAAVTVTAGLIERLLSAPEGMVGGLTRHYLFLIQGQRLRQLWHEIERRAGPEASLAVFRRALG